MPYFLERWTQIGSQWTSGWVSCGSGACAKPISLCTHTDLTYFTELRIHKWVCGRSHNNVVLGLWFSALMQWVTLGKEPHSPATRLTTKLETIQADCWPEVNGFPTGLQSGLGFLFNDFIHQVIACTSASKLGMVSRKWELWFSRYRVSGTEDE